MRNWQPELDTDSDIGFFETSCANMNLDLESARYTRQNPVYCTVYNIQNIIYCILYGLRMKKSISELSILHLNRNIFREALMVRSYHCDFRTRRLKTDKYFLSFTF